MHWATYLILRVLHSGGRDGDALYSAKAGIAVLNGSSKPNNSPCAEGWWGRDTYVPVRYIFQGIKNKEAFCVPSGGSSVAACIRQRLGYELRDSTAYPICGWRSLSVLRTQHLQVAWAVGNVHEACMKFVAPVLTLIRSDASQLSSLYVSTSLNTADACSRFLKPKCIAGYSSASEVYWRQHLLTFLSTQWLSIASI